MKRLMLLALLALLALLVAVVASPVSAQVNLRFQLPKVDMDVYVQKDASARLVYDLEFTNVSGRPNNAVEMGLPHGNYDDDSIKASTNGVAVTSFRGPQAAKHGVIVDLGSRSFQGNFHFEVTMRDMVFQDSTNDELASFQITPTWFGRQYVVGTTDLTIRVHLPAGITDPDAVLWHEELPDFTGKSIEEDSAYVEWHFPTHSFTGQQMVGVSFPKSVMDRIVVQSRFDRYFGDNGGMRFLSGVLFMALFGLIFFRFTGGTGIVVFIPFLIVFCIIAALSPIGHLVLWPVLLGAGIWAEWMLRRRATNYLPPLATVEGGGVKRGFTAPEVAVILELPLSTVCSLVLTGLLRNEVLRPAEGEAGEKLEIAPEYRGSRSQRRQAAADRDIVLHKYEQGFLDTIDAAGTPFAIKDVDFSDALKAMVENVAGRMKGHDLEETRAYYRGTVEQTWAEAESKVDPTKRDEVTEKRFEWLALDEKSSDRFEGWRSSGYFYRPAWLFWHFGPTGGRGDACGWLDSTCDSVQNNINVGFEGDGGVINLGGIDSATGSALQSIGEGLAEGGSYSGGGGCAGCACACAGCACACACAGGGT